MDVDDLFEDVSRGDDESVEKSPVVKKTKKKKLKRLRQKGDLKNNSQKDEPDSVSKTKKKSVVQKHKESISNLQEVDPEFYEFLKNEDKELLDFNVSDEDSDDISDEEKFHQLPSKLEVDSDAESIEESDNEADKDQTSKALDDTKKIVKPIITLKMINTWGEQFRNGSLKYLKEAILAFKSAVVGMDDDEKASASYIIEGGAVFNEIVRLCITEMIPCVSKHLKLKPWTGSNEKISLPSSCKNWEKIKVNMKTYTAHLVRLLGRMSEPAVLNVLLKHVHMIFQFVVVFPDITKMLLKRLFIIWSSGEETSRVLAFLSITRITRAVQKSMLDLVLKQMYISYVKNCKFTSPTILPMINFMQRCLVEMFSIDFNVTYQYAFVYIRQLAIHLRNAITMKKEETKSAVYNWQFIHSLHLWTRLLSLKDHESLQPLIYPLTQTIIGTLQLVPIARYFPLRFHCIRFLNTLALSTRTFIPTLPFLLEIFEQIDFNKKPKSLSNFKPYSFACILKFTKPQLGERAFRDGVIEQMFELLLDTLNIYSCSISFPEVCLPVIIRLKDFLKKCKIANYTKQMKTILDKVQETSKVIVQKRKSAAFSSLNDTAAIEAWETNCRKEGTPLSKFYKTYRVARDRELLMDISNKEQFDVKDVMPRIERPKQPKTATPDERKEFSELFDNDDSGSDGDENRFLPKEERTSQPEPVETEKDENSSDQYSDFDDDDLEQLAKSASEDDGESSEDEESDDQVADDNSDDESNKEDESDIMQKEDVVEDFHLSDSE